MQRMSSDDMPSGGLSIYFLRSFSVFGVQISAEKFQ